MLVTAKVLKDSDKNLSSVISGFIGSKEEEN